MRRFIWKTSRQLDLGNSKNFQRLAILYHTNIKHLALICFKFLHLKFCSRKMDMQKWYLTMSTITGKELIRVRNCNMKIYSLQDEEAAIYY